MWGSSSLVPASICNCSAHFSVSAKYAAGTLGRVVQGLYQPWLPTFRHWRSVANWLTLATDKCEDLLHPISLSLSLSLSHTHTHTHTWLPGGHSPHQVFLPHIHLVSLVYLISLDIDKICICKSLPESTPFNPLVFTPKHIYGRWFLQGPH